MKHILKVFYALILMFIGFNVYTSAIFERNDTFYQKEAIENLEDKELFVKNSMFLLGASEYNVNPIYKMGATADHLNFNFEVYHYLKENGKDKTYALAFYLFNIETDKDFNKITAVFSGDSGTSYVEKDVSLRYNSKNISGNLIESFDLGSNFSTNNGNKILNIIKSIEIIYKKEVIVEIINNDDYIVESENNSEFTYEKGKFTNKNFNGNVESYESLSKNYIDNKENILKTDNFAIKPYNKIVTKKVLGYTGVALLATFLVFFLEPTVALIKRTFAPKEEETKEG